MRSGWLAVASFVALAAGTAIAQDAGVAHPDRWPSLAAEAPDAAIEARIDALIAVMSLEQKVGQIVRGDIGSTTPEDVAQYHLGSILNSGSSSPGGDEFGPASAWVAAADAYYAASMRPNGTPPRIPVMWGSDAVHGHNNIVGATLFPHNIGLGAARNPALMEQIGQVTAIEQPLTGPIFMRGRASGTRQLQIDGVNDSPQAISGAADNGAIAVSPIDRDAQEDAREIVWSGRSRGTLIVANPRPANLSTAGALALTLDLRVDHAPSGPATLEVRCGPGCTARLDIADRLAEIAGKGWQSVSIPLACLPRAQRDTITAPSALSSSTPMRLTLSSITLTSVKETPCR